MSMHLNTDAGSGQEGITVRYTARTHTSGGRRGGVSHSDDGRLDVQFSAPGVPGAGTNPELEKAEAEVMKATSITVPSSHVPMVSHPREVADLIEQAAAKAGKR